MTTINIKLSLTVNDNGVLRTASSVVRARYEGYPDWSLEGGPRFRSFFEGNAVRLEMPGRGTLYMLLAPNVYDPIDRNGLHERFGWLVPKVFGLIDRQMRVANVVRAIGDLEGSHLIPHDWLPQMQNIATAFGPGIRFVEASVAITREPITTGIETRLRWLQGDIRGQALDPDARGFGQTFPQKIRKFWFRRTIDV